MLSSAAPLNDGEKNGENASMASINGVVPAFTQVYFAVILIAVTTV